MSAVALKSCSCCNMRLPLTDFPKRSKSRDGLDRRCKPCVRLGARAEKRFKKDTFEREADFIEAVNAERARIFGCELAA